MTPTWVRLTGRSKPTADAPPASSDMLRAAQVEYLEGALDPNAPNLPAQPRGRGWAKVLLPSGTPADLWSARAWLFGNVELNDDTTLNDLTQPRAVAGQGQFDDLTCRFITISPTLQVKVQEGPSGSGTLDTNQLGKAKYRDRLGNEVVDIPLFNPIDAYQGSCAKDDMVLVNARWPSGENDTEAWQVLLKPGGSSSIEFVEIIGGNLNTGQQCVNYNVADPVVIPTDPSLPGPFTNGLGTGTLYRNGQAVGPVFVRHDYASYALPLFSGRRMAIGRKTSHTVGTDTVVWYHPAWE